MEFICIMECMYARVFSIFVNNLFYSRAHAHTHTQNANKQCSYNAVNGVPSCANKYLDGVLRTQWGFSGYITSDSGALDFIYSQHHYVCVCTSVCGLHVVHVFVSCSLRDFMLAKGVKL